DQYTIATAFVYWQRFFIIQSLSKNDPYLIASACLLLAGKVEENFKSLQKITEMSFYVRNKKDPKALESIKSTPKLLLVEMDRVVKAEEALLVTMNFDFFVSHPYKPICSVVKEFGFTNRQSERDRTFFQIAWNFANDSLRTTLCLQPFRPMDIAAACVNLSATALSVQLPKAAEGGHWWTKYGVSPETLQDVELQIMSLYKRKEGDSQTPTSCLSLPATPSINAPPSKKQRTDTPSPTSAVVSSHMCQSDAKVSQQDEPKQHDSRQLEIKSNHQPHGEREIKPQPLGTEFVGEAGGQEKQDAPVSSKPPVLVSCGSAAATKASQHTPPGKVDSGVQASLASERLSSTFPYASADELTRRSTPVAQQRWGGSILQNDESWILFTSDELQEDKASTERLERLGSSAQLDTASWTEHSVPSSRDSGGRSAGVPVFIMLPLDSITMSNTISRPRAFRASLTALKSAGVEGVMMDVWWGIVEREGPGRYDWSAYKELVSLVKEAGLKVQAVMSFHQCGGNVGDHCMIPLPPWIHEAIDKNNDIVYTDRAGRRNREYLSLGCDDLPVLQGRTPIQAYSDFMRSFRDAFSEDLGSVITEIQVGMGPAGELRYPSYPEGNGMWQFPGIGEFQCYDKYMLSSLRAAAEANGKPNWGLGGPHDSGYYKQWPQETGFFHEFGNWNSQYGHFFLQWYSEMLIQHGDRVLSSASSIFRGTNTSISGKVAGIHWHYGTKSHPPELTAGYYNTIFRDGYIPLARMFARHGAVLNFTCIEMKDAEQPWYALCSPEGLLRQVAHAAHVAGTRVSGENALPRFDEGAFNQIVWKSRLQFDGFSHEAPMSSFTFLRMNECLFRPDNWRNFVMFVRHMREGRTFAPWDERHRHSHAQLHATGSLTQAAAALMLQ
ncbi:unnamed protein product, partial [Closterium sp. NIES-53]